MQETERIKQILEKINIGSASKEEVQEFQSWFNSFEEVPFSTNSHKDFQTKGSEIWQRIERYTFAVNQISIPKKLIYTVSSIAAMLLIGFYFVLNRDDNKVMKDPLIMAATLYSDGSQIPIKMEHNEFLDSITFFEIPVKSANNVEVVTRNASMTKVVLPDGTKVTLNVASKLYLENGFNEDDRTSRVVHLEGEAYFDVAHHANRQFVVKAKDQEVRVLGTKFNIKSLVSSEDVQTTLYQGKIEITSPNEVLLVKPNQMVLNSSKHLELIDMDMVGKSDWRKLYFSFEEELVGDVIIQLANRYNLEIHKDFLLPKMRISGNLSSELSLLEITQVLSNLTGLQYKLDRNILTISK